MEFEKYLKWTIFAHAAPVTAQKRIFVSTPHFRSGIPATVSEVTRERNGDGPLLRPFPSWDAASQTTCEGPVSVYRIHVGFQPFLLVSWVDGLIL